MRILLCGIDIHDTEVCTAFPERATIFSASTADELIESVSACSPDLLLVTPTVQGIGNTLQQISLLLPTPVIVIAHHDDSPSLPIASTDIFGYLIRPVNTETLSRAIAVASAQFQRLQYAHTEAAQLREAFASRKLIERAKGLIMQRQRVTESEAYTFLREESRRQRIPIAEIAQVILGDIDEAPTLKKIRQPVNSSITTAIAGSLQTGKSQKR